MPEGGPRFIHARGDGHRLARLRIQLRHAPGAPQTHLCAAISIDAVDIAEKNAAVLAVLANLMEQRIDGIAIGQPHLQTMAPTLAQISDS